MGNKKKEVNMIRKIGIIIVALSLLVLANGTTCLAKVPGPINKLSYGLGNLVTGVVEIPKQIITTYKKNNIGIEAITTGLLKGVVYCVGRTLAGAVDTVFFLIPPYDHPLIKPITEAY